MAGGRLRHTKITRTRLVERATELGRTGRHRHAHARQHALTRALTADRDFSDPESMHDGGAQAPWAQQPYTLQLSLRSGYVDTLMTAWQSVDMRLADLMTSCVTVGAVVSGLTPGCVHGKGNVSLASTALAAMVRAPIIP
jgi:hypothetical protein